MAVCIMQHFWFELLLAGKGVSVHRRMPMPVSVLSMPVSVLSTDHMHGMKHGG